MAPRKQEGSSGGAGSKRPGEQPPPKDSEDYKKRRERNNVAVRKSRELSRQKAKVMEEKVSHLRAENKSLEDKVKLLSKELGVLKDLFLSTATLAPVGGEEEIGEAGMSILQEVEGLSELKSVNTDHEYSAVAWNEQS